MRTSSYAKGGLVAVLALAQFSAKGASTAWSIDPNRLGLSERASTLIGFGVQDKQGKKIGVVSDFVLDLQNGQVWAALVAGKDATRLTPVPANTYYFTIGKRIEIGVPREQFLAAPQVTKAQAGLLQPSQLGSSYAHFHCALPESAAGKLVSATSVLGANVAGSTGEPLGKVRELLLDLQRSRIIYVVVDPTTGERCGPTLYVVPPTLVTPTGEQRLTLALSKAEFVAGPRFQTEFWVDIISPRLAADVCGQFHLSSSAIAQQPAGKSDREVTQAILTELTQSHGSAPLSVVVTTLGGHVTITGTVKDDDERRGVIAAAERIVGAGNVEDRLEARHKSGVAKL